MSSFAFFAPSLCSLRLKKNFQQSPGARVKVIHKTINFIYLPQKAKFVLYIHFHW